MDSTLVGDLLKGTVQGIVAGAISWSIVIYALADAAFPTPIAVIVFFLSGMTITLDKSSEVVNQGTGYAIGFLLGILLISF